MGKTRTAVVSGVPEETKKEKKKKQKHKKSLREEKGVRIPGLKGGERIVAVDAGPVEEEKLSDSKADKDKEKKERKPRVRSKKYQVARAKVDKTKLYPVSDAIKLVKETSYSSFNGTVELHLIVKKVGLTKNLELPYSTGKAKKVEIASEATIAKLKKGKIDFDLLLATPEMMPRLVPFAKTLGPRGLMPNPKTGTLIKDLPRGKAGKKEAKKFSGNTITVKTEKKAPLIHTVIGKVNQKVSELAANAKAIISAVDKKQIIKAHLTSTMGPSVKLDLSS